jgi:hypothetical protein
VVGVSAGGDASGSLTFDKLAGLTDVVLALIHGIGELVLRARVW